MILVEGTRCVVEREAAGRTYDACLREVCVIGVEEDR
jgi:hypothetical protein